MIIHDEFNERRSLQLWDATFAFAKRKTEKIQSCQDSENLDLCDTGAALVANCADKPTGKRSLSWFVIFFLKLKCFKPMRRQVISRWNIRIA